jgi:hypothetical protein
MISFVSGRDFNRAANGRGKQPCALCHPSHGRGNRCPLLTEDPLCRIQRELGASLLPHSCATYPRMLRTFDAVTETALTLSCPEPGLAAAPPN